MAASSSSSTGTTLPDAELKDVDAVLEFWYTPAHRALWFRSTPDFDAAIRTQFLALHERAAGGECDAWADAGAVSSVALCVLLDQFPRNMFRGTARAFATDAKGEQVALTAIARGFDAALADGTALSAYRQKSAEAGGAGLDGGSLLHFLLMPLMHSERLETQELSVQKFSALGPQTSAFAALHRDVIKRFGRFPGRNKALGRESTAEEAAWLESPEGKRF